MRYLESRLLTEAAQVGRFTLEQNQAGGSKLPESDREDMEVFLRHVRQLLPVLGSDLLAPIAAPSTKTQPGGTLVCRVKGAEGFGQRSADGFVVFKGSTAVLHDRPSAQRAAPRLWSSSARQSPSQYTCERASSGSGWGLDSANATASSITAATSLSIRSSAS